MPPRIIMHAPCVCPYFTFLPGPGRDKQMSFSAQYLAAVKLLGAASSSPPGWYPGAITYSL